MVVDGDRRAEALKLAEELIGDIELGALDSMAIARKTSRVAAPDRGRRGDALARVRGSRLPTDQGNFTADGWWAAQQSNRVNWDSERKALVASPLTLGQAQTALDTAEAALAAAAGSNMVELCSVVWLVGGVRPVVEGAAGGGMTRGLAGRRGFR
jgi:hypothetical protein